MKATKRKASQADQAGSKMKRLMLFFSKVTRNPKTAVVPASDAFGGSLKVRRV